MAERLAIIGASGFVGSALTEYAADHAGLDVMPFCHSTGGASRLAHRGMSIRQLDLMDRAAVDTALSGVDYVVNCSRGGDRLMLSGLENLLHACSKGSVKKLVHLSSVAVYGDPPPASSTNEDAPTEPAPRSYGATKLAQDRLVQRAASKGLPSVILCPPNIIGPYSDYLTDIIQSIETGRFRYIDGGHRCINVVDVNNLSACMINALRSEIIDGRRLFACEPADVNWLDLTMELEPVLRDHPAIPSISSEMFVDGGAAPGPSPLRKQGLASALKHLASDEVRTALRGNPMWASMERISFAASSRLLPMQQTLMTSSASAANGSPSLSSTHFVSSAPASSGTLRARYASRIRASGASMRRMRSKRRGREMIRRSSFSG